MDKEFKRKLKKQYWKIAGEDNWSLKDRIHGRLYWAIFRHFPPRNKELRKMIGKIKYATKLLKLTRKEKREERREDKKIKKNTLKILR